MGALGVCTPPGGIQMYRGCTNIQGVYKHGGVQQPPSIKTCLPLKSRKKPYLKLISYTYRAGKNIREPPDCTGNEPTLDIHIGGSGQDIKNKMADTCYV